MKGIILYTSKYGATERYAQWLAEETGFDCVETRNADIEKIREYDTVILGGGVYASSIAGLSFLKKHIGRLRGKKVIVFCVGASPSGEETVRRIAEHNLKDALAGLPCFYCRGAMDTGAMGLLDRNLCRMRQKAVAKKKPEDRDPLETVIAETGNGKSDWTDRQYLAPVLEAVRQTAG